MMKKRDILIRQSLGGVRGSKAMQQIITRGKSKRVPKEARREEILKE